MSGGSAGDLQPGEDLQTPSLSEARHWLQTYERMVWLKIDVLARTQRSASAPGRRPAPTAEHDLARLREELRWLEERRRRWEQRVLTLEERGQAADG
ncbi:MAG: hypothetical protein J2P39_04625 [Candidatus Dormibacteraeota bacterium]|nr:hypothetical protein [Candidatus Dormibacteraeota bacterium]